MDPFGTSRSRVRDDHALICPDSFVAALLPGWKGAKGVVLASPRMGARFVMILVSLEAGAVSAPASTGVERVVYLLDGLVSIDMGGAPVMLGAGGFAYLAPDTVGTIRASEPAQLCMFEKRFVPLPGFEPPESFVGAERDIPAGPFLGDPDARLRVLLPDHPRFDLAVNVFTFGPGAALPMVEVHVMEHGLLMLDGLGVYRLGDAWYPVQQGDAIWMAPYCPQWFVAMGKGPARYLYYKDVNRDPLTTETGA